MNIMAMSSGGRLYVDITRSTLIRTRHYEKNIIIRKNVQRAFLSSNCKRGTIINNKNIDNGVESFLLPDYKYTSRRFKSSIASSTTTTTTTTSNSVVDENKIEKKKEQEEKNVKNPELKHIRKFPIIGSIIPQLSGIPNTIHDQYKFWPELRRQYGDFYTIGLPSFGNPDDIYKTVHVITDPNEMVKVIRASGGAYPSGFLEKLWVVKKWYSSRNMHTKALFENGPEWKRLRTFMQTDLLHPESARGYIPGMIEAAKLASAGAPAMKNQLNQYLGLCAFDLFHTIFNGELTNTANPNATSVDPENIQFATNAAIGVGTSIAMMFDLKETILGKVLGFETTKQRQCFKAFDEAWDIGQKKINTFMKKKESNQLNESEKASYLYNAIERQKKQEKGSNVTIREAQELAYTGLFAAVDTTSSVIGWNLYHIARLPHVQEKLYQELLHAIETIGDGSGNITTEVLNRKNVPYLHAVIRETQRLTPSASIKVSKRLAQDLVIHGVSLKKGDAISLEGYSTGMDPNIITDGDDDDDGSNSNSCNPNDFVPERWLSNAIKKRKGTKKEILDHPYFKNSFSQGARKCPGSRVASNEIQVMLSQLILDWKMTTTATSLNDIQYIQKTTIELQMPEIDFQPR